ncbi:Uncharacterised protein [Vibrio cholerae]|nr:Uncharacterised protein [Vibrio cholerae]
MARLLPVSLFRSTSVATRTIPTVIRRPIVRSILQTAVLLSMYPMLMLTRR